MKIKYHDNTKSPQYINGHLSDNWDPDASYSDEYVSVYFRIDTPSYDKGPNGCSFLSDKDRDAWNKEAEEVIQSLGILSDSGWEVSHSKVKQAYLYARPQNISGVVPKKDVRKIAETIAMMTLSSIRWVDLYETVYLMTDDEYETYLDGKDEEIQKLLFESSRTTRRNRYCTAYIVARNIANHIRLNRLGCDDGVHYGYGQTALHILKIAEQMGNTGLLDTFRKDDQLYIRSLNKTELKSWKKTHILPWKEDVA